MGAPDAHSARLAFLPLAASALACSVLFAALQERVFGAFDFPHQGSLVTLVTSATFAACGSVGWGWGARRGCWKVPTAQAWPVCASEREHN